MLKDVRLKGFTVFNDTTISFAKGINIITGENGTGKTHVLKAIYPKFYIHVSYLPSFCLVQ